MDDLLRRWCEDALGYFGWTPRTFWRATIAEFFACCAGHNRANRPGPEPLTSEEFKDLAEQYPDNRSLKSRRPKVS